jgi:hypothetical protein
MARLIPEADRSVKSVGTTREINARKKAEQQQQVLMAQLGIALAEKERL